MTTPVLFEVFSPPETSRPSIDWTYFPTLILVSVLSQRLLVKILRLNPEYRYFRIMLTVFLSNERVFWWSDRRKTEFLIQIVLTKNGSVLLITDSMEKRNYPEDTSRLLFRINRTFQVGENICLLSLTIGTERPIYMSTSGHDSEWVGRSNRSEGNDNSLSCNYVVNSICSNLPLLLWFIKMDLNGL